MDKIHIRSTELIELLEELEDYFEAKADVDYDYDAGRFIGNQEMRFLVRIREALTPTNKNLTD